jgi:hypothetical protein
MDKAGWAVFGLVAFAVVAFVGLFGWVVIELVSWLTSK